MTYASSGTKPIADTRVRSWSVVAWGLLAKSKIWTTPQVCLRPPPCSAKFLANKFVKAFNGYLVLHPFSFAPPVLLRSARFQRSVTDNADRKAVIMIELKNLSKTFFTIDGTLDALKNINITIQDGDIFGIIGMSGAGKSTLVRCINLLERPSSGSVLVDGVDLGTLGNRELRNIRRDITMIFQGFNLLMQRTCLKNVCFPMELEGKHAKEAKERALELLEIVGLRDKANSYPSQLSGGQQQRVAIARALATNPKVLLCDEATSALDPKTTQSILSLIKEINERLGITVVVITHQMSVIEEICRNVAILENGEVVEQGEVSRIFSAPRSQAAKHLVFPDVEETLSNRKDSQEVLRVIFNGSASTDTPLIAKMAVEIGVCANILYASTKSVGDRAFGSMLLSFPNDGVTAARAADYLRTLNGITVEEVR